MNRNEYITGLEDENEDFLGYTITKGKSRKLLSDKISDYVQHNFWEMLPPDGSENFPCLCVFDVVGSRYDMTPKEEKSRNRLQNILNWKIKDAFLDSDEFQKMSDPNLLYDAMSKFFHKNSFAFAIEVLKIAVKQMENSLTA